MSDSGCQHLGYLAAAFGAVWLLVGAYVGLLWRRERRLRREVEALRRSLSGSPE